MKNNCTEHNVNHWGPFCPECFPELFTPSAEAVSIGGVKLIGRNAEPAEVAAYLEADEVAPTIRLEQVYCSPDAPDTVATRVDRRRGWRWEAVVGLPDSMRGEKTWARGALRFTPGWDRQVRTSNVESLYVDSFGEVREATPDSEACRNVDEGVIPPNLDPMARA